MLRLALSFVIVFKIINEPRGTIMKRKKFKLSVRSVLTVGLLTLSSLSFTSVFQAKGPTEGTNQSYMLFDNGEVATTRSYYPQDEEVKLINADHMFILPGNADHTAANYLFDKDGELYTIDAHGYMYHKEFYYTDSNIKHYGGNYFVTRKGQFHIVKNDGIILNYDGLGNEDDDIRKLRVVGGNYFVTRSGKLFVVQDNGYYVDKTEMMDFKSRDVKYTGNNYLVTKDGVVYTFGTEVMAQIDASGNIVMENGSPKPLLDANGNKQFYAVVYKYDKVKYENIAKLGGNFFFDTENNIHTISNNGIFDRGIVARKLKVSLSEDTDRSQELPVSFGTNYFVYGDGALYTIDRKGYYYFLKKLERRISETSFSNKLNKKK